LDKLESGFYENQKLPDGTPVNKPTIGNKCSHGGALDKTSLIPATGGINKDSGIYLISPHADLHLKAAQLAIDHTKVYFNNIRSYIGDDQFEKFLTLNVTDRSLGQVCNANINSFYFQFNSLLTFFTLYYYFIQ
jgi:hypothetical protein